MYSLDRYLAVMHRHAQDRGSYFSSPHRKAMVCIVRLTRYLNRLSTAYHTLDEPIVPDAEYDRLYDILERLELDHSFRCSDSPTMKVGGMIQSRFKPVKHRMPMYSLLKCHTPEQLSQWHRSNIKRLAN